MPRKNEKPLSLITDWYDVPVLMDTPLLVRITGLTEETLRSYRDKGELPYIKLNRAVLYAKEDVLRWIDGRKVNTPSKPEDGLSELIPLLQKTALLLKEIADKT